MLDNLGFVLIGTLSLAIATLGGSRAIAYAGFIYFLIGPMKWALGEYAGKQHRRLQRHKN